MTYFIALTLLLCIAGLIFLFGTKNRRLGLALTIAVVASVALSFVSIADSMGRPRPVDLSRIGQKDAVVVSAVMKEGIAIYLFLQVYGMDEPRLLALPWDRQLAEHLQKALDEGKEKGNQGTGMHLNFEKSWDHRKPLFYPIPQPKMPDKPYERGGDDA